MCWAPPLLVRAVDFNRLYAENAALQWGYDATRLGRRSAR